MIGRTARTRTLAAWMLALWAITLAGCGSSPTAPQNGTNPMVPPGTTLDPVDQEAADDLAVQGVMGLNTVGGSIDAIFSDGGAAPSRLRTSASDTVVVNDGLTYSIRRTFYDAEDNELPGRTPDAVRAVCASRAAGTRTRASDTLEVASSSLLDLRGLPGTAATECLFNGTMADTLEARFTSLDGLRTRRLRARSQTTISDVRIPFVEGGDGPTSGSVQIVAFVQRLRTTDAGTVERNYSATITIVFHEGYAEVMVNGTWHYRWIMGTNERIERV